MHIRTKIAGIILGLIVAIIGTCFMSSNICTTSKNPTIVWGFVFLLLIGVLSSLFSWVIHGFISLSKMPEKIRERREAWKRKRIYRVKYPASYARLRHNKMNEIKLTIVAFFLLVGAMGAVLGICWLVGHVLKILIC